ncbi:hypothetical protein SISNIDRAFT_455327 [Sistotremastrum niveocremeum HHB9708]|uniref:Uncharacterized protein n=1 Tax=Sistotremastrum niveocremeum HHB9708 TaxID=1314777 RepID=A0A164TXN8_9AGAM|nr:hypothetical protein SISNIDRAFT_455327 [Sistotremastrum niveocremeum HHB9708]
MSQQTLSLRHVNPYGLSRSVHQPSVIAHDCILKMNDVLVLTLVHLFILLSTPHMRMLATAASTIDAIRPDLSTKFLFLGPMTSAAGLTAYALTLPPPSRTVSNDYTRTSTLFLHIVLPFILASAGVVIALIGLSLRFMALSHNAAAVLILVISLPGTALWIIGAVRSLVRQV